MLIHSHMFRFSGYSYYLADFTEYFLYIIIVGVQEHLHF